jgi:hypothetical protein
MLKNQSKTVFANQPQQCLCVVKVADVHHLRNNPIGHFNGFVGSHPPDISLGEWFETGAVDEHRGSLRFRRERGAVSLSVKPGLERPGYHVEALPALSQVTNSPDIIGRFVLSAL